MTTQPEMTEEISQRMDPTPTYIPNQPPPYTAQQQHLPQGSPYYTQQVMTSSVMQPTQPIVVQIQKPPKLRLEKYNDKLSRRLAIVQFVFGGLSILLSCTGIPISATTDIYRNNPLGFGYFYEDTLAYYIGTGIWVPLIFISFSGAFSMCAARQKTECKIVTNMVFCILSSILCVMMLGFALWALIADAERIDAGFYFKGRSGPEYAPRAAWSAMGSLALSVMWLVVTVGLTVACVWSATLCCRVTCCESTAAVNETGTVQYTTNPSIPTTHLAVLDTHGKHMPNAKVIQIPAQNVTQTNQGFVQ